MRVRVRVRVGVRVRVRVRVRVWTSTSASFFMTFWLADHKTVPSGSRFTVISPENFTASGLSFDVGHIYW